MDRNEVVDIIKRHEFELRALGVQHLSVFGSTARGTTVGSSDVDVAVSLAPEVRGLERVGRLDAVEVRLSELLQRPVDVVEDPARSPQIRRAVERDGIRAF